MEILCSLKFEFHIIFICHKIFFGILFSHYKCKSHPQLAHCTKTDDEPDLVYEPYLLKLALDCYYSYTRTVWIHFKPIAFFLNIQFKSVIKRYLVIYTQTFSRNPGLLSFLKLSIYQSILVNIGCHCLLFSLVIRLSFQIFLSL